MSQAVLIAIGIDWDGRRRSWPSTWPILPRKADDDCLQ
jgi:hypothetical protein